MPEEIYESGYPMKSLMDAGIVVSSSTDAPCGESVIGTVPNIIGANVNGLSPAYLDVEPLNPDELLTVRKVLKCLTINGAASLGLEKERGSIEVGKYADFVVLDKGSGTGGTGQVQGNLQGQRVKHLVRGQTGLSELVS